MLTNKRDFDRPRNLVVSRHLFPYLNTPLRFGNKKGFAVPHNGIIFSENSEKISSH